MQTSLETTITADTAKLESQLAALAELTNHKRPLPARKAGKTARAARRVYRGRSVLVPGKRKAARHPWADRLHAARTGGFVIDQTHPDSQTIVGSCYACGHRFGFVLGDDAGQVEFEREVSRHELREFDEGLARECTRGVVL
jgi:hypothetical protein